MIKNYNQLAVTNFRKKILDIINAGLAELGIKKIINKRIKLEGNLLTIGSEKGGVYKYNLENFSRIFLVSIGKGSAEAAETVEKILGAKISKGIAIDIKKKPLKYIKSFKGNHPVPSPKNLKAAKKVIEMVREAGANDLVLVFIFGGGSALFCAPAKISLADLKKYTQQLLASGKDIYSINTIRKHFSSVKGGNLAKLAYPAAVVSCIFSDVPGDDFSFIASGPTVKDKTTVEDARAIAKEFGWPKNIFVSTPKQDRYFEKVKNILMFSNHQPLLAMEREAKKAGFSSFIHSYALNMEAKKTGKGLLEILRTKKPPVLLLAGGELTVVVRGRGKGGRNQEMVLGSLPVLKDDEIVVSLASDGWDNTEAAGAVGDIKTKQKARKLGLNPEKFLENNDSFHFFKKTKDLIFINRGVNVADFIIVAKTS